ncbi:hypothetical protein [Acidithiobacillus sp.]|uniref:hypothetical protein n=1 Tax=Acidithiobacillus sp. TaxID=1872118 RepID=UPI003D015F7C
MFRQGARISTANQGYSALDYAAEAGMIITVVEHLPTEQLRTHVMATYGFHQTALYRESELVRDTSGCSLHVAQATLAAWVKHDTPSMNWLAHDAGLPRREAERQYQCALGTMRGWDKLATSMLAEAFEARGWIDA